MNGSSAENVERNGLPYQGTNTEGFAEVLQRLSGERKAIASDLNLPYRTYSNYVQGLASFPPDLIARLFAITGEWSILEFILEPLDLHAVPKIRPTKVQKTESPDVYRMLMDIIERIGNTIHELKKAKSDNKISPDEDGRIGFFLREIQRLSASAAEVVHAEVTT